MKRLIIICEGQTEQEFCNQLLAPYIQLTLHAPLIKKSNGGIVGWKSLKKEIEHYLISERDTYITTLIDYYGITDKHEFPNWETGTMVVDKTERMNVLEEGMRLDIAEEYRHRFLPYIQLHEFEGLLFNDIQVFYEQIPQEELIGEEELKATFNEFPNPEMINNSPETSPSHRLERIIKGYNKVVYGCCLAEAIGLEKIRNKSPRFNQWIENLETIR